MKIVSITPDIDSGGAAKSLFVLARAIQAAGHNLHIVSIAQPSRTNRKVEELESMGVTVSFFTIPYFPVELIVCPIPFWANLWRAIKHFKEFFRLAKLIKTISPDVLHLNSYTVLHTLPFLKKYKTFLHAREVLVEPSMRLSLVKRLMKGVDHVIAISPEEGEQAKRLFCRPVSTVFNVPLRPIKQVPLPKGSQIIAGVFSHITPIKGQLELVRACALAASGLRKANVQIRLFGGTVKIHQEYYNTILQEIADHNLEDIVIFKGFTDEPEEEMKRCHLIVRPDATGQPWGRDVIESMSMGRPVLATGYRQTFVQSGKTGFLVPPRDIVALAKGLLQLANVEVLQSMSDASLVFAKENFVPQKNCHEIIAQMEQSIDLG